MRQNLSRNILGGESQRQGACNFLCKYPFSMKRCFLSSRWMPIRWVRSHLDWNSEGSHFYLKRLANNTYSFSLSSAGSQKQSIIISEYENMLYFYFLGFFRLFPTLLDPSGGSKANSIHSKSPSYYQFIILRIYEFYETVGNWRTGGSFRGGVFCCLWESVAIL
jgi:hypothetical protein